MRSVYGSFLVHSFDIATDIIVILQWWYDDKLNDIDHIDTRLMAQFSIGVVIFHKIISSIAIYISAGFAEKLD